ncbi:hypothetical protein ACQ4M4_24160 [Leptolyngbya sp. AN02str]|uniref:hypothetical protein n=1 Tax=Leptolyngbya sp. AN02str TaxID=3423363 RepID=UPI003D3101D0
MANHPKKQEFRFLLLFAVCAVSGVVLNSSAALAENTKCVESDHPTYECVTKSPTQAAIEGGIMGLVAGSGAAVGAVWRQFFS